ncbi:UDP-N-acetylglucosamine 1-carboxyvinyltransferase [Magnetospirillum gryphiswaldense]|uniref:UDP-N-acetylglucosamine 1-carboxyvinyltransferase n=1 Tax=Magnetospirillum gryphiswaldense TaxID=55518 RepID=A4TZW0_9PROT|nr:UDP-N-acetylglucosamine 1-carboxyvinyltransferase [Magnetospirillum gryphiswaldense]AVM74368.1 UDP-N-acetylglucosamine 1-carboxyvinyltransferase [Magnetospirillum gryphiswaldense MSR-1]AVM78271.1 UDP-N-acetylglucosamine 1-carboxyvinyltransferase [Magnetospirillum gryphiswaldense]CAM76167.1 UDP-N-acetylglucosamine 1-carboxyvinyltransferase [Magnetospirillum gryphiswaldense MSR-1]
MDRIRIIGGTPLKGIIAIGGAKNAALTLMPACLLTDQTLSLSNLPHLVDITTMANLLAQHGVGMALNGASAQGGHTGRVLDLTAAEIVNTTAPYDLVRKMRASVLVLGPLLARCGQAKVSLPGGCAIGTRPVDLHLKALEQMGAVIELTEGYIHAKVEGRLKGAHIIFPQVTVGGTENILMAATLAEGETVIANAAREPEVTDLAQCLVAMGAKIEGIGTGTLRVQGQDRLHGAEYSVVPDRIETGTYAVAAAITRGDVELVGARYDLMESVNKVLRDCGVVIEETARGMRVCGDVHDIVGTDIMTEPYPGFPTDMQAQLMALAATANGASMITETIFENRYMHVPELLRMGARVNVHGSSAIVRGVKALSGAQVMATDLRASSSLILAGLAAQGETIINRVYHLDRGYERVEEKLAACGANIERIKGDPAE